MSARNTIKVFLPKKLSETGGTSTFARNLKHALEKNNYDISFEFKPDYDVLLVSPTAPIRYLLHAKLNHRPILHRLDGTYYPGSSAGWLWWLLNLQLALIRNFFADAIVYQSKFSEQSCNKFLGKTPKNKALNKTLIYNGVDTKKFSPKGEKINLRDNPDQVILITASRFRTEDQIIPLLDSFKHFHQQHEKNSKLIIVGPFQERVTHIPTQHHNTPNVVFLNTISNNDLPKYLRSADIFIMTHKTPPCPNNVLEAMASGLPICGVADGAMPELVTSGTEGELIPEPTDPDNFPSLALAKRIKRITQNQAPYSQKARIRAEQQFTLTNMTNAYDSLLQNTTQTNSTEQPRS